MEIESSPPVPLDRFKFIKTSENKRELEEKIQEAVIQAYFLYEKKINELCVALFFSTRDTAENVEKSFKAELDRRKFLMEKSDAYAFLKRNLAGPKKNFNEDYVGILRTCELRQGYPLETKLYVPIVRNANMEEKLNIETLVGPNSLNKPLTEEELKFLRYGYRGAIEKDKESEFISRNKCKIAKTVTRRLKFVMNYIIRNIGVAIENLRCLSDLLKLPLEYLIVFWMTECKLYLESKSIESVVPIEKPKNKAKVYKYCSSWCNICMVFLCNLHFIEQENENTDGDLNYFFSYYKTQYKFPKKFRNSCKPRDKIDWVNSFNCKTLKKNEKRSCYRLFTPEERTKLLEEDCKFKKFERELINHFREYKTHSACFLYLIMKNANSTKTCIEISLYLQKLGDNIQVEKPAHQDNQDIVQEESFSNKGKRRKNLSTDINEQTYVGYTPCFHDDQECNHQCECIQERKSCDKFCSCKSYCKNMVSGCDCQPNGCLTDSCPCVKLWRECDPEFCKSCACDVNCLVVNLKGIKIPHCRNTSMLYNIQNRLILGKSTICAGLGLFAGRKFEKQEYVGEYVGEIISYMEGERRDMLFRNMDTYYSFNCERDKSVDSFSYGNKTRFINHARGRLENCTVRTPVVQGVRRIALYAKKDINIGEELFFNYGTGFKGVTWLKEFNSFVSKKESELKNKKKRGQKLLGKTKKDFQDYQPY